MNDWAVIHVYTREQAIDDGVLVVIPEGEEYGFRQQFCVTAGVRAILTAPSERGEEYRGRLHDLLFILSAIRQTQPAKRWQAEKLPLTFDGVRYEFFVSFVRGEGWTVMLAEDL